MFAAKVHLVSNDQLAYPVGHPVLTACGTVRPRKLPPTKYRLCRRCKANVAAIDGRTLPPEES